MFLLSLVLFILIYVVEIYVIEFFLPPFGSFYYTDIMDILISFATDLSMKLDISFKFALVGSGVALMIIPFIILLAIKLKIKRRKKKILARYRF